MERPRLLPKQGVASSNLVTRSSFSEVVPHWVFPFALPRLGFYESWCLGVKVGESKIASLLAR